VCATNALGIFFVRLVAYFLNSLRSPTGNVKHIKNAREQTGWIDNPFCSVSILELGVDIGSLDAVIMMGFPFSLSALVRADGLSGVLGSGTAKYTDAKVGICYLFSQWQQSGRGGRRQTDSLTILVTDSNPFDQVWIERDTYHNHPN
jgi:hypothetical protein